MHRCLSDGTLRSGRRGGGPLELVVLGGGHHYEGEEYVVAHILADQVPAVAEALASVDQEWLRERLRPHRSRRLPGRLGDEDFEYIWQYLQDARGFYKRAAAAGRPVIFTVDQ